MSTFLLYVVIPAGPRLVSQDLDVGIFYALAVSSLSVIGILMAGWASANKYSLIGAPAGRRPAHRLRAAAGAGRRRRRHPGRHMSLQGIVHAQADGEIFGFGGIGNPFILTQFVGFLHLPRRRPGRAHPDAVRHAGRRVRAGRRLHDRVLAASASCFFFIGRVRHRLRLRRPSPPRCSSAAGTCPASTRHHGRRRRPARARRQDHARRLPHLLGPVHATPASARTSSRRSPGST